MPQLAEEARIEQDVKRWADVVGIFLSEQSILRLIGEVLLEANDSWALQHCYMQVGVMAELTTPLIEIEGEVIPVVSSPALQDVRGNVEQAVAAYAVRLRIRPLQHPRPQRLLSRRAQLLRSSRPRTVPQPSRSDSSEIPCWRQAGEEASGEEMNGFWVRTTACA